MSCMKVVFTLADAVPWDEITCTESLFFFFVFFFGCGGGGGVVSVEWRKKYLVLSF